MSVWKENEVNKDESKGFTNGKNIQRKKGLKAAFGEGYAAK